jgi:RHS repeat-associated protein
VLVEATGEESTRNLYGLDLLAQQSGATTYLGYDALSVRLHMDEDGATTAQYQYGPFGETIGEEPESYGFTGERWDGYIKMTYLRTRYYSPELGRFISRDIAVGDQGRPGTLHLYAYVTNSPVNLIDPSGQASDYGANGAGTDVVGWLLDRINQDVNSAVAAQIRLDNSYGSRIQYLRRLGDQLDDECLSVGTLPKIDAYIAFMEQVLPGHDWDYKERIVFLFGLNVQMFDDWYKYDVPTNIHFGYVGTSIGFSALELKGGAGVAQLYAYFKSQGSPLGPVWNFFDDPYDQAAIELGIELHDAQPSPPIERSVFKRVLIKYADRLKKGDPFSGR